MKPFPDASSLSPMEKKPYATGLRVASSVTLRVQVKTHCDGRKRTEKYPPKGEVETKKQTNPRPGS